MVCHAVSATSGKWHRITPKLVLHYTTPIRLHYAHLHYNIPNPNTHLTVEVHERSLSLLLCCSSLFPQHFNGSPRTLVVDGSACNLAPVGRGRDSGSPRAFLFFASLLLFLIPPAPGVHLWRITSYDILLDGPKGIAYSCFIPSTFLRPIHKEKTVLQYIQGQRSNVD